MDNKEGGGGEELHKGELWGIGGISESGKRNSESGPATLSLGRLAELRRAPEAGDFGVNVAMRPAFAGHAYAWTWRDKGLRERLEKVSRGGKDAE